MLRARLAATIIGFVGDLACSSGTVKVGQSPFGIRDPDDNPASARDIAPRWGLLRQLDTLMNQLVGDIPLEVKTAPHSPCRGQ